MPVTAPALKAMSRPRAMPSRAPSATRTLDCTEIFIPMQPAAPENTAPITKPPATQGPSTKYRIAATATPTMAMVLYWRLR
jgi:hypothetical protein